MTIRKFHQQKVIQLLSSPDNILKISGVCAQQEYQLNRTTYLHNDCYPIKQNVQKTYWYTIFDYGEIDWFEADSNLIRNSNEMAPAMVTITPEKKTSNLGNILINDSSADMIANSDEISTRGYQRFES